MLHFLADMPSMHPAEGGYVKSPDGVSVNAGYLSTPALLKAEGGRPELTVSFALLQLLRQPLVGGGLGNRILRNVIGCVHNSPGRDGSPNRPPVTVHIVLWAPRGCIPTFASLRLCVKNSRFSFRLLSPLSVPVSVLKAPC